MKNCVIALGGIFGLAVVGVSGFAIGYLHAASDFLGALYGNTKKGDAV